MFSLPSPKPQENIFAVLAYFDMFNQPLTSQEIRELMPGPTISEKELQEALNTLKNIENTDGFYYLKGRKNIVEIRKKQTIIVEKLWKKVRRFVPFLQMVPFIKMVAVCNTLAFGSVHEKSDIDLFIVTAKNRIFLARTLSTLLFTFLGIRRYGQKIAGRFCLSFYVSEEAMDLERIAIPNDIYLVYWLKTLRPLYGETTWPGFLKENVWLQKYFPNITNQLKQASNQHSGTPLKKHLFFSLLANLQAWILGGFLGDFLEKKLSKHQQKRYEKHLSNLGEKSSVIITNNMLKFHNLDRRKEYAEKFEKSLN